MNWERLLPSPNNRTDKQEVRLSLCRRLWKTGLGVAELFTHNRQSEACKSLYLPCHVFLLLCCAWASEQPADCFLIGFPACLSAYLPGTVITSTCPEIAAYTFLGGGGGVCFKKVSRLGGKKKTTSKTLTANAGNEKDEGWLSGTFAGLNMSIHIL